MASRPSQPVLIKVFLGLSIKKKILTIAGLVFDLIDLFFQKYLPYRDYTQKLFVSKYFLRASVGAFIVKTL